MVACAKKRYLNETTNFYPRALSMGCILMTIPQILHNYDGYRVAIYAVCYTVTILTVFYYLLRSKVLFNRFRIFIAILYAIAAILPFVYDVFSGISIASNDVLDLVVKIINIILFFLLLPSDLKIQDFSKFFYYIMIFVSIACVYNLVINVLDMPQIMNATNSYSMNFMSFFANRNTFAIYLFIGILCSLLSLRMGFGNKKIIYGLIVLELFNLLLTMSRGGILASAIVLAPSCFRLIKRKPVFSLVLGIILIVFIAFLSNNPSSRDAIVNLFLRPDAGTSGRSELWATGIEYLKNTNMIVGTGYYTSMQSTNIDQFHSLFIDTLVDNGILGLLIKITLFLYAYVCITKANLSKRIKATYKSGFISLLFLSFFESVNIFVLGSTETLFTAMFISLPILLANNLNDSRKDVI